MRTHSPTRQGKELNSEESLREELANLRDLIQKAEEEKTEAKLPQNLILESMIQLTKNILGKTFLEEASWGNDHIIGIYTEEKFPVNYQHPGTGSTALHEAASTQARDVVRVLLKTGDCDFLLRDNKGRLASEMAYLYGHDPALARLLGNKERKQAAAMGIKLTRRPS